MKSYLAVTAAKGCLLGAQLCKSAGVEALQQGYGFFAQEVQQHVANYVPKSVTLDGWDATRQAWQA